MADAATLAREAELRSRFRDVTKPDIPLGSSPESLRSHSGFENISDEILQERATFNLKEHLGQTVNRLETSTQCFDFRKMTVDELHSLVEAALNEMSVRRETENT